MLSSIFSKADDSTFRVVAGAAGVVGVEATIDCSVPTIGLKQNKYQDARVQ